MFKKISISVGNHTHKGMVRTNNQDSFGSAKNSWGELFIVADGMGGHKKGEVASDIASSVMNEKFDDLVTYVQEANKKIYDYQDNNADSEGMGTTMTAVKIDGNGVLHVAHVGDSRCYVLSKRQLIKLTEDENVPGFQNVLLQALGTKKKLDIQKKDLQLNKGDVILLCTDGLYNEIGEEYMKKKLQEGISADTLVSEVLLQEPKDNVTAIIINVI